MIPPSLRTFKLTDCFSKLTRFLCYRVFKSLWSINAQKEKPVHCYTFKHIRRTALLIRCPKYWSFNFSISPSNEYSGLIPFRMDWSDLLESLQGTLKSLLQCHSSKTSILLHSAFFMVELSHLYLTAGKTIALTIQTSVDKVMFLQVRNPV